MNDNAESLFAMIKFHLGGLTCNYFDNMILDYQICMSVNKQLILKSSVSPHQPYISFSSICQEASTEILFNFSWDIVTPKNHLVIFQCSDEEDIPWIMKKKFKWLFSGHNADSITIHHTTNPPDWQFTFFVLFDSTIWKYRARCPQL